MNIIKHIKLIVMLGLSTAVLQVQAQRNKKDRYFDVYAGPSLGFRVLGNMKMPANYKGSEGDFKDSLDRADRPGQSLNFGIQYMVKKSAFGAFSFGLSYTNMSFRRVAEDFKIGYEVHPDVGIVAGVIQAGALRINYDIKHHYLEVPMLWHKSAEGYSNLQDYDLWYTVGIAPAVLLRQEMDIKLVGFTLNGKNRYRVQDSFITGMPFNAIVHLGFRSQYHMYKNLYGLVEPRLRVPILPSSRGAQQLWTPQFSLNVGLVFVLSKSKTK
jgi:hypothetical protein